MIDPEPVLALTSTTSIGSLPHRDPAPAVRYILDQQADLPAAPSLPAHHPRESMVAMAAWGIAGVTITDDGSVVVDRAKLDPSAPLGDPGLDAPPFTTLRTFLRAVRRRTGPVKLQLPGPVTLGLALRAAGVVDDLAFRIAGSAVRDRARAMLAVAGCEASRAPLVVFLDEPALVAGWRDGFPLNPDQTIDLVSSVLAVIEPHAVTGLHCCGGADWRVALQTGPQVLSLPVGVGLEASAGALASFVERGGWVAWGAVPTDGPLGESAVRLWRRLSLQWCELVQAGCDPVLLRTHALITPACGLAYHGLGQADHVLELTRQVADRLHDQLAGVRLTVGA